jgi:DNA/RNA-binding protein KIN17
VQRVIDRYVGEISMLDSGDVVRVDQEQLETVIPSPGGAVLVSGARVGRWGSVAGEGGAGEHDVVVMPPRTVCTA